jgi:hypothetical protein
VRLHLGPPARRLPLPQIEALERQARRLDPSGTWARVIRFWALVAAGDSGGFTRLPTGSRERDLAEALLSPEIPWGGSERRRRLRQVCLLQAAWWALDTGAPALALRRIEEIEQTGLDGRAGLWALIARARIHWDAGHRVLATSDLHGAARLAVKHSRDPWLVGVTAELHRQARALTAGRV